jgi:hypothetical protein
MSQENVEIVRAFVEAAGRDPKHGQRSRAGERISVSVYRCSGPLEARERSDAAYSVAASRARAAAFM